MTEILMEGLLFNDIIPGLLTCRKIGKDQPRVTLDIHIVALICWFLV